MSIGTIVFLLLVAAAALPAVLLRRRRAEAEEDPGGALLDFGAAFPDAAVRDVVRTADGRATFLRLADGRTGLVKTDGVRQALRMIEPGDVHLEGPVGDRGLGISFTGDGVQRETFLFARPEDAAEVSLWLCTALAAAESRLPPHGSGTHSP